MQSPSPDAALLHAADELSESRHMPGAWIEDPLPVSLAVNESVDANETVPTGEEYSLTAVLPSLATM